ncbi:DC-STAMP domain-containing protein 2-like [Acanthaster planci]|uniref:DC-STAMP domain-containing protein 2-like n=1 Tax=Acanthaster planci TaxID=133434 RepID=A0A8B7ZAX0_ACAPL|nr:DC-STAMP domain-containing protein 2-like [Acanthaster planci]
MRIVIGGTRVHKTRHSETVTRALDDVRQLFNTDVDFETYWENRFNRSQTFDSIQAAIQQELEDSFSFLNLAFSVIDKIVAVSIVFLLIRSYQYHSKYRTKDRFDNCYITEEFKLLDERRQKSGREPLLPLKKSERRRLINLSSVSLSKPEKGLFKLGLVTVLLHAVIAAILILADYGLFWLLSLISRHGRVKFEISGGGGTDLTIGGSGVLSKLIQSLFVEGFAAASEFNVTLDTEHCLPNPVPPNEILSVGIGVLYLTALVMVLFQAYALRLRRRIASYFYPEREQERIHYLYNHTLQRRQNLFKLLKQRIRQTKHEMEVEQRVSFVAYLSAKYPFWRRVFLWLGQEKRVCLGCADVDNGTFKSCGNPDCSGLYCRECLHEINSTCTLCQEIVVGSDLSIGVVEHRV